MSFMPQPGQIWGIGHGIQAKRSDTQDKYDHVYFEITHSSKISKQRTPRDGITCPSIHCPKATATTAMECSHLINDGFGTHCPPPDPKSGDC